MASKTRISSVLLWTFVLSGLMLSVGLVKPAQAIPAQKKVVILEIPRLDLAAVSPHYPCIYKLLNQGSVGLMPFNSATSLSPQRTYLYFGSGVVLNCPLKGCEIYNAPETVRDTQVSWRKRLSPKATAGLIYESRTGRKIEASNAVNIGISGLLNSNKDLNGSLADFLGWQVHRYSVQTAAIGNSDAELPDRASAAIVMDEKGLIDWGAVGSETLTADAEVPFGVRSDPDQLMKYFRDFSKRAQLIIITLGDLERVEKFKNYLSAERKEYFRNLALTRYDQFLSRLVREIDFDSTQLILLTCLPLEKPQTPNVGLTPIMIKGPGFHSGVLSSSTTRKSGIITYHDLRTLIVAYLNPQTPLVTKNGLSVVAGKWQNIGVEQSKLIQNYLVRWPLLTVYSVLLIGIIVMIGVAIFSRLDRKIVKSLYLSYLFLLTIPATFLLEALFDPVGWPVIIVLTLGIASILFQISVYFSKGELSQLLGLNALITIIVILIDGLFNGYGEMKSFFGYSAVSGARFYGIGNEYFGVMLGAIIVLISLNLKKVSLWSCNFMWMIIALIGFILFHPAFGSKIGGGLTTLIGLGITLHLWYHHPIHFKDIGRITVIAVLALGIMGAFDYYANHHHMTHLGQLVSEVKERGFHVFLAIILRKLELNWSLIQSNPISFLLIGILVVVPILYKYQPKGLKGFITQFPDAATGFTGLCITGLVALILNDTGIAAAATMFMYGIILIFLPLIKERMNLDP